MTYVVVTLFSVFAVDKVQIRLRSSLVLSQSVCFLMQDSVKYPARFYLSCSKVLSRSLAKPCYNRPGPFLVWASALKRLRE